MMQIQLSKRSESESWYHGTDPRLCKYGAQQWQVLTLRSNDIALENTTNGITGYTHDNWYHESCPWTNWYQRQSDRLISRPNHYRWCHKLNPRLISRVKFANKSISTILRSNDGITSSTHDTWYHESSSRTTWYQLSSDRVISRTNYNNWYHELYSRQLVSRVKLAVELISTIQ